jgi:crotonobetaine/carnitine-CoA ligase
MRRPDLDRYENRVIGTVLREQAAHIGDDVYLMDGERRSTFAEVDAEVNRMANVLSATGVGKGDRVTLLMENSDHMVRSALAVNKLGAIWTTAGTDFRGSHLQDALTRPESDVLITDTRFLERLTRLGHLPQKHVFVNGGPDGVTHKGASFRDFAELSLGQSSDPDVQLAPSHPSAILWTSGTTGRPKGSSRATTCG